MAGLSVVAAVPGVGDGVKAGTMAAKGGKQLAKKAQQKAAKKATERAAREKLERETAERLAKEKAEREARQQAAQETATNKGKDGAKVKGKKGNTQEKGRCGEWLARQDMMQEGYDKVVAVQNNSGHGVDLIGRNSKTGEVKVWEVKTTDGPKAPGLKGDQRRLGGEDFTKNRLNRAAAGQGNYGKVPEAVENAEEAINWLKKAGDSVSYEKREVFVDDLSKGCMKHPNRPSKTKPWISKVK